MSGGVVVKSEYLLCQGAKGQGGALALNAPPACERPPFPPARQCFNPRGPFAAPFVSLLLLLVLALALSTGCSLRGSGSSEEAPTTKGSSKKRGTKPYTIRGQTYHPLESASGFTENGIASWYGRDFHGKTTANGERYNMYGMTAAHKLLPFGTQVRVTNKNNGKSIVVRINDRGPFVANRVIDLTKTGAEKIDMLGPGTAPVRLEAIGGVAGLRQDGNMDGKFYVQVGAFRSKDNADRLVARLTSSGSPARSLYNDNDGYWRVQVGPVPTLFEAQNRGRALSGEFSTNFVIAE